MLFIPTLNKKLFAAFVAQRYGSCPDLLPPCDIAAGSARYFGLRYVGLQDENGDLMAAMMLFEYKSPGFPPFFFACRGCVLGHDKAAVSQLFIAHLRVFARDNGAMCIFPAEENLPAALLQPITARPFWFFLHQKAVPLARRALAFAGSIFKKRKALVSIPLPSVSVLHG